MSVTASEPAREAQSGRTKPSSARDTEELTCPACGDPMVGDRLSHLCPQAPLDWVLG